MTTKPQPSITTAGEWNRRHPRGTLVKYYPGGRNGKSIDAKTARSAYHLGSGTAVVSLEGIGPKPLASVEAVALPAPPVQP